MSGICYKYFVVVKHLLAQVFTDPNFSRLSLASELKLLFLFSG